MLVTRCVCHDLPFARLLETARREGLDFEALSARTKCSTGCGMCGPYVRLTLATGRTAFPPMSEATLGALLEKAERESGRGGGPPDTLAPP